MNTRTENIKDNLMVQVEKLYRNCNEKSYETRARYRDATERFCDFLAENYGLQKFANIKDKHLAAYVADMKQRGIAPTTMQSDLSGIRFFHRLSGEKFTLLDNKAFALDKRQIGKQDRAWSEEEITKALRLADSIGRVDISLSVQISRQFGTRIEETCKMRVWQVRKALESQELYVKGKGGQVRYVPVRTPEQRRLLGEIVRLTDAKKLCPNDYIISDNIKGGVEKQIKRIQNWLSNHSGKFVDENRGKERTKGKKPKSGRITFHGLRHKYAQELNRELKSYGDRNADSKTSEALGHHRKEITKIYLNKTK